MSQAAWGEGPARRAYEAYSEVVGRRTWDGRMMPTWDMLTSKTQEGWRAAATEGQAAYNEQDVMQEASAAEQAIDSEGAGGPTEQLARAWHEAERILTIADNNIEPGEYNRWDQLDDDDAEMRQYKDDLRKTFAILIRGGHLHVGRPADHRALRDLLEAAAQIIGQAGMHRGGRATQHFEWQGLAERWEEEYAAALRCYSQPAAAYDALREAAEQLDGALAHAQRHIAWQGMPEGLRDAARAARTTFLGLLEAESGPLAGEPLATTAETVIREPEPVAIEVDPDPEEAPWCEGCGVRHAPPFHYPDAPAMG